MPTSTDPAASRLPALPTVDVYHGADGVPVVDIDTAASGPDGHGAADVPYLRVAINDDYVHEHNPAEPLRGSRDALDLDSETGPYDEHHHTHCETDVADALQIAACIGMDPLVDPDRYPDLQQRGLIRVQVGPGTHKHAAATAAGHEILRRALPNLGRGHPEL